MATKKTAKKASKRKQQPIPLGDFQLEFRPKYERAMTNLRQAGKKEPTELELLTEYDKQGGRISYEGETVKMGSFWDFEMNQPRKTPKPTVVKKKEVVEEEVEMEVPLKEEKPKKEEK